jgi:hypothetical protein
MALTMRPTGLGSGIDKDRQDYTVYTGGWDIGRIYEVRGGPEHLRWFWSFTLNGPMTRSDRAASSEEAKAQFQKSWDAWKAWAKLDDHERFGQFLNMHRGNYARSHVFSLRFADGNNRHHDGRVGRQLGDVEHPRAGHAGIFADPESPGKREQQANSLLPICYRICWHGAERGGTGSRAMATESPEMLDYPGRASTERNGHYRITKPLLYR